ncbi:hypothetical protein [Dyadobacter sp. CY356]|uniref:hypothetical protein n=1 Tax=Dyadobacter sp. CY356 TaxID=2906442 RepID=UPI001F491699|nr:hypothetical protein [Dyadobacter sp. CY356]MCF0057615.1 hypothetical protein [Dyadobacter sp. CY356]
MNRPVPSELLDKYLNGTCTSQESAQVEGWYQSFENNPELDVMFPESKSDEYSNAVFEKIRSQIKLKEINGKISRKQHNERLSAISSLISQAMYTTCTIKNVKFSHYSSAF